MAGRVGGAKLRREALAGRSFGGGLCGEGGALHCLSLELSLPCCELGCAVAAVLEGAGGFLAGCLELIPKGALPGGALRVVCREKGVALL